MHTQTQCRSGFTIVEVMIVVAIIGMLVVGAMPSLLKARTTAQRNACIANLRQIDNAKERWAMENKKHSGDSVDAIVINSYLRSSEAPACPADGIYSYNVVGVNPSCSLGASLGHTF